MNDQAMLSYLDELKKAAHSASAAEENLRREFTRRFADLEKERQFAFRRHGLMLTVWQELAGAKEEAEVDAACDRGFERELGWSGASEMQRTVTERFRPVGRAMWRAARAEAAPGDIDDVARMLTAFEAWYAETYKAPFLVLLEQETQVFPLVEI